MSKQLEALESRNTFQSAMQASKEDMQNKLKIRALSENKQLQEERKSLSM